MAAGHQPRWRAIGLVAILALAVGVLYVALVPPGAPYDEPSHFDTVRFYAENHRLPELGEPGVSYEAHQPPLYYVAMAPVYLVGRAVAGEHGAFYSVRLATMALLLPLALAVIALVNRGRRHLAVATSALVVLSAPMIALSASIQNDTPVIVLVTLGAAYALHSELATDGGLRPAGMAGLILGLALLTKTNAASVVLACVLFAVVRRRPGWQLRTMALALVPLALCGWWFARNLIIYGDVTGHEAILLAGYPSLNPAPLTIERGLHLSWTATAYHWTPAEFYRNVFTMPLILRAGVAVSMAVIAFGVLRLVRRRPVPREPLIVLGALAIATAVPLFLVTHFRLDSVPPRLMFTVLPWVALGTAAALTTWRSRYVWLLVFGLFGATHAFVLYEVATEPSRVFHLW